MKTRNRLFAILLALAMVITYMPGLAFAVDGVPEETPAAGEELGESGDAGDAEAESREPGDEAAVQEEGAAAGKDDEASSGGENDYTLVTLEAESAMPDSDLEDNDSLLWDFLYRKLEEKTDSAEPAGSKLFKARGSSAGSRLDGTNKALYESLKEQITAFVDPNGSASARSSVFDVPATEILEKDSLETTTINGNLVVYELSEEDFSAIENYDGQKVISALLSDMPYELYWFDKTSPYSYGLNPQRYYTSGSAYYFEDMPAVRFTLKVSADYSVSGEAGTTEFSTDRISAVKDAISNAANIIDDLENESDLSKLRGYKDIICEMTSYDFDAAGDEDPNYGDPWQLISVFDGDKDTKVVCEGYSKAFQYLCDNTVFEASDTECFSVTGYMDGGTGKGPHMWNVVTYIDKNYLVDVTNCDDGTVGEPDQLFMAVWTEKLKSEEGDNEIIGYRYSCRSAGDSTADVDYVFDEDMFMEMSGSSFADLDKCRVIFGTDYYQNEIPFYTVDMSVSDDKLSLEDLEITVEDESGRTVASDNYDLTFSYWTYDEANNKDVYVPVEPPFGVQSSDDDYGMTEYCVSVTAKEDSSCTGSAEEYFYVRDKHSLQWMGSEIVFENGLKDSWRMRDRYWIKAGDMTAPEVYLVGKDIPLTAGTDYTLTYYRTNGDPSDDDPDKGFDEYIDYSDEYKLDAMPTEAGHYFARIEGIDPYMGTAFALFDIVDYTQFAVDYDETESLWSDDTKKLTFNVPEGISGSIRISGIANSDNGATRTEFELTDDCYSYEDGVLTLNGSEVLKCIGYECWMDLKIDFVDSASNVLARGLASFQLEEASCDFGFEEDRDVMPGWDGSIQDRNWFSVRNQKYPEGWDGEYQVESVEVISGKGLLDGSTFYEKKDEDENTRYYLNLEEYGYEYRIKEWSADFDYSDPVVEFEITYTDPVSGSSKSYRIKLNVKEEIYEIQLVSDDNRNTGLPGHEFGITARTWHKYYNEDGEYREDSDLNCRWYYAIASELDAAGKGYDGSDEWQPDWTVLDEGGLIAGDTGFAYFSADGNFANLRFVNLKEDLDADAFYVRADVEDSNGKVRDSEWNVFFCRSEYNAIEPSSLGDLERTESTGFRTYELRHYSIENESDKEYSVIDADFTWYFDNDAVEITGRGSENDEFTVEDGITANGNEFNIERLSNYDTEIKLEATWTEELDNERTEEFREEKTYHLDDKEYDFYFDSDTDDIFTDGNPTYTMKGRIFDDENWQDKFKIEFGVGIGDWVENEETGEDEFVWSKEYKEGTDYTLGSDGRSITIIGSNLEDRVDEQFVIMASLVLKKSGSTLNWDEKRCQIREPREDFSCDTERDILAGWDGTIDKYFNVYYENSEYPYGFDKDYEVTDVEASDDDISKYLSEFHKDQDEDSDYYQWYYRAKDLEDDCPTGTMKFTVHYIDPDEEIEEGDDYTDHTYTLTLNIVDDVYDVWMHSEGSRYNGLPGDVFNLSADGKHEYFDDNGEQQNDLDGYHFEWSITSGGEYATLAVDEDDPSKAVLTFKSKEELDEFCGDEGEFYLDEEIKVKVDLVKDEDEDQGKGILGFLKSLFGLEDDGVVASRDEDFWLHTSYEELYPLELEDLGLGKSLKTSFELREYNMNGDGYPEGQDYNIITIDGLKFYFDENAFEITNSDGNNISSGDTVSPEGEFTITRTGDRGTDIRVEASWQRGDDWIDSREQNYWFDEIDTNIDFNNHDINVYTDVYDYLDANPDAEVEYQHILNIGDRLGADWDDSYDCEISVSYGGEAGVWSKVVELESDEYTVTAAENGNIIVTLTESFMDKVSGSENGYADIQIEARVTVKGDEQNQLAYRDAWFHVSKPEIEYQDMREDEDILPNNDDNINAKNSVFVRNTAYPDGRDFSYEVTGVEVSDGWEYLVDGVYSEDNGKYYLKPDSDDDNKWWYYRIKGSEEITYADGENPAVTFEVTYKDYDFKDGDSLKTYTFTRRIVTERYFTWIDVASGCDQGGPGASFDLTAGGWKEFIDENGGNSGTDEGFTFNFDIVDGSDAASLEHGSGSPDAKLTFNDDYEVDDSNKRVCVKVSAYFDGSEVPVAEYERDFWIVNDHVEMFVSYEEGSWVTNKTPDLMPGESATMKFQLRQYENEATGGAVESDELGSYCIIEDPAYSWNFDENAVEIRPVINGEAGESLANDDPVAKGVDTFRITRKTAWETDLILNTDYGDKNDPYNYHMRFDNYDANVGRSEVVFKDTDGNTIDLVEDYIPDTEYTDCFYKVHIGTTAAPELTLDGNKLDSKYFNVHYTEMVFVDEDTDWNIKDNTKWSDTFPTEPGVYLCEIDGVDPFYGTCTWLIKVEDHLLTAHEAKGATCDTPGNTAYWSCDRCGKYFSDEAGKTEIEENSWVIAALGHKYGEPTYEWVEDNRTCTAKMVCENDATHIVTETADSVAETTDASCEAAGKTVYTANFENSAFKAQTKEVAGDAALDHKYGEPTYEWADDNSTCTAKMVCENDTTHVVTETVNSVAETTDASCEAAGKTVYTANFENSAFKAQTKEVAGDAALGHNYGEPTYEWADDNCTCTAKMVCENDTTHVVTETVNSVAETTDASCEAAGKTVYTATFENSAFKAQTKEVAGDAALDHKLEKVVAKEATTGAEGNIEYWVCDTCGKYFSDAGGKKEISKKDTVIARIAMPAKGSQVVSGGNTVTVTSSPTASAKTVAFTKAKNAKTVTVPATVEINGVTYKVTEVKAKAFTGSKIRTVNIGANVKKINKNAFKGSKATKLIVKSKNLTKAGVKGSLKGSKIKTVSVKVGAKKLNKTYVTKYKKFFTKKNAGLKVTVK